MRIDNRLMRSTVLACAAWVFLGAIAVAPAAAQNAPARATAPAPAPAAASAPAAPAEPAIIRVWSSDIHDADDKDPGGTPAISVVSPRGGMFSGKVVAGASGAIVGLKATASDLKGPGGTISADQVRIRYAVDWDPTFRGRVHPKGEDVLLDQAPADVVFADASSSRLPVWVTVRVPRDAKTGSYAGTLTIEAKANKPVAVPVKVEVLDWTVPAPQDYRTVVELVQSPDTLALEYNVPLWSPKHWDLVSQSLRHLSDSGSRTVYLPLICQTNQGNEQTMVRWIKKGENQYEQDFSILDKYLDLVEKDLGKPKFVVLYAWDVLLTSPPATYTEAKDTDGSYQKEEKAKMRARAEQAKKGIPVTGFDPATGKVETINLPSYIDPASKALWMPVYKGIRERLAKRGLEKAAMMGMLSDWRPSKEEFVLFNELSGNLPWGSCSHHLRGVKEGVGFSKESGVADIGLAMIALDFEFVANPEKGRKYGWKIPYLQLHCWQARQYFNSGTLSTARQEVEADITGGQRGLGHMGADFWQCIKGKNGNRVATVTDRYPQAYWHSMNIVDSFLAPGPTGPAATVRLELFQEGMQECEARIALESVLTNEALRGKIGLELAKKAQDTLDERQRDLWLSKGADDDDLQLNDFRQKYWNLWIKKWDAAKGNAWFVASGWQKRTADLFAVAGEVEKKAPAKP